MEETGGFVERCAWSIADKPCWRKAARRSAALRRRKFARGISAVVIARALSWLPLAAARAVGRAVGRFAWRLQVPSAAVTTANVERCFPDLPVSQQRALSRESLIETCCLAAETGFVWHAGERALQRAIEAEHGVEQLDAARASRGGALLLTPHFGNWEVLAYALGGRLRLTFLYERPADVVLDRALVRARSRWGVELVAADVGGLRRLKRALGAGAAIGLLPDQTPRPDAAVSAPFFGVPAATMTLAHRLVGADTLVLLVTAQRSARGFRVCYERVDDAIKDADPRVSAAAMNRAIEAAVRRAPAQYQWEYKRFRVRRPRGGLAAPIRGREQHEQGEDFQPAEQHGEREQPLGRG